MVKFTVRPTLCVDDKQQASGGVKASMDHGNATYSVSVTADGVRNSDPLEGLRLGMKLKDGSLEAIYEPSNGNHMIRVQNAILVRDKVVGVRLTDIAGSDRATFLNCSVNVDDNNTAKVIYRCNPGNKLDHRNATVGWVYRKDDIEIEPRFNLGTESLSAGVTYRVDADNRVRGIYDMGSNEAYLTWFNTGSLGGGGETRISARMRLDKDNMQQMPTLMVSKNWDLDM